MIPIKYEPLLEIVKFNGEKLYIEKEKEKELDKILEQKKFLYLSRHETRIAVSSIETIRPARQETNLLENTIAGESEEIKQKVRRFAFLRAEATHDAPLTQGAIENMIKKAKGLPLDE